MAVRQILLYFKALIHMLASLIFRVLRRIFVVLPQNLWINVLASVYAPTAVFSGEGDAKVKISWVTFGEQSYCVTEVRDGRLFTTRNRTISVMSRRALIPNVSWQFCHGDVLPDSENDFLRRRILPASAPHRFQGCVVSLLSGGGGNYNYYHWLFDVLPRLRLVEAVACRQDQVQYLIPEDTLPFQRQTLDMLGIEASRRLSSKDFPFISADTLITSSHPNLDTARIPAWIMEFIRESFLDRAADVQFSPFVYISRRDSVNVRRLVNEDQLCDALRDVGFGVYLLSELSVAEQIALFARARIIVSVHGAGLANLVFASIGAVVYELFSGCYQPYMYASIAARVGLDYHAIVCDENITDVEATDRKGLRLSDHQIDRIRRHAERLAAGVA